MLVVHFWLFCLAAREMERERERGVGWGKKGRDIPFFAIL